MSASHCAWPTRQLTSLIQPAPWIKRGIAQATSTHPLPSCQDLLWAEKKDAQNPEEKKLASSLSAMSWRCVRLRKGRMRDSVKSGLLGSLELNLGLGTNTEVWQQHGHSRRLRAYGNRLCTKKFETSSPAHCAEERVGPLGRSTNGGEANKSGSTKLSHWFQIILGATFLTVRKPNAVNCSISDCSKPPKNAVNHLYF